MLESHGNISILLSEVHELLLCDSPLNLTDFIYIARQTDSDSTLLSRRETKIAEKFQYTNHIYAHITITHLKAYNVHIQIPKH